LTAAGAGLYKTVTGLSKSKAVRELELTYRHRIARLEFWTQAIRVLSPSGAAVAIVWLVTGSINRLAGKFTYADVGLRFFGDFRTTLAYTFTAAASGWALLERKLKGDNIKRLSARVTELERRLDPDRTSSRLTERGTTRPGDD
jgi:hypothetical protein